MSRNVSNAPFYTPLHFAISLAADGTGWVKMSQGIQKMMIHPKDSTTMKVIKFVSMLVTFLPLLAFSALATLFNATTLPLRTLLENRKKGDGSLFCDPALFTPLPLSVLSTLPKQASADPFVAIIGDPAVLHPLAEPEAAQAPVEPQVLPLPEPQPLPPVAIIGDPAVLHPPAEPQAARGPSPKKTKEEHKRNGDFADWNGPVAKRRKRATHRKIQQNGDANFLWGPRKPVMAQRNGLSPRSHPEQNGSKAESGRDKTAFFRISTLDSGERGKATSS